jgi:tetratricopeptide (TPR) repeat protein
LKNEADNAGETLRRAMGQHQAGQLEAARRLYLDYLDARPADPEAWCLLGSLEGNRGRHDEAEQAFRKAINVNEAHAQAHVGLGTSLLMQARPAEAAQALADAVALAPEHPDLRIQLAHAQSKAGRPDEAVRTLREVVGRWPEHLPGQHHLGVALLETDRPDAAAACFRHVTEREQNKLPALIGLGRALAAANEPEASIQALREALALAPDDARPRGLIGDMLRRLGRFDEAQSEFDAALKHRPGDIGALVGMSELDRVRGEAARGLERLQPVLAQARPPGSALLAGARLLLDAGNDDSAAAKVGEWLELEGVAPATRAALQSARGRALDRLGRYDEAWQAWTASHEDQADRFDGSHFNAAISALRQAYDKELFDRFLREEGPHEVRPLLVVGPPRSGKSILEQMLASHPKVTGGGELRHLGAMTEAARLRAGRRQPYPDCVRELSPQDAQSLGAGYLQFLRSVAAGNAWVVDTQPTNFLHVGLAAITVPPLRVVVCQRDPLDTAWACIGRRFADPALAFAATPGGIALYLAGMREIMDHWIATAPVEVLQVAYEDLVCEPAETTRRVLDFMGLDWDDACSDYLTPGNSTLRSAPVLREPVDDREIGRGHPYRERFAGLDGLAVGPD